MRTTKTKIANNLLRAVLVIMSFIFIMTCTTIGFGATAYGKTENGEEVITQTEPTVQEESVDIFKDGKIYCEATIDDDFADDGVIVVLDEKLSRFVGVSQDVISRLFSLLNYKNIESLTDIEEPSDNLLEYYKTHKFRQIYHIELGLKSKQYVLNVIRLLEKLDGVLYAGPNYFSSGAATVNDPLYNSNSQWGLNGNFGIDIENAWNITKGSKNVRVGVIDSGIADHDDLRDNVVAGYDFYHDNSVTDDDNNGHGTHVAGIIGAVANNIGIAGVAPNINIVPLQTAHNDEGYHYETDVIEAINYATKRWGTDEQISILNHSILGYGESVGKLTAISQFPGLFVWCAGNEGKNVDNFSDISKFKLNNIISVGGIDGTGARSDYDEQGSSNYGRNVDIFAPGSDIPSTSLKHLCENGECVGAHLGNGYHRYWGTSMAAPQVAGVAALLLSMNPGLTAAQVKTSIINGSEPITIESINTVRLSASKALQYADSHYEDIPAYLRLKLVGKSGSVWRVRLINVNNYEVKVTYNSRMCFNGDASSFSGLKHLKDIVIGANDYKTVDIEEYGTACYITAAIKYQLDGNDYRRISYVNELDSSDFTTNAVWNVERYVSPQFPKITNDNLSYLRLKPTSRSGGWLWVYDWEIEFYNPNPYRLEVRYNKTMCFADDAKDFKISNTDYFYLDPYSSRRETIKGNGTACYITACIEYSYYGYDYRMVTYANNLTKNSNNYSLSMYYNKVRVL